jgi:acetyl-CoA synthetase (ADP-forming)
MPERIPARAPLSRILSPASVAVIGASEDTSKFGGRVLHHLIKHGYSGRIAPVNPKRASLRGLQAYPNIAAAGPVDVAVIAVPPSQIVEAMAECAAAEVAGLIVITAQMGEIGGEGAERERAIVKIARDSGLRIIGPNCLGVVDANLRMALTASFAMGLDSLPAGRLAVVSQSGALMATMFNAGYDSGAGFSKLVSIGNQADVTENEVFETLLDDPETGGFAFYVEGFSDAGRFLDLAARARQSGKPVVVVKAGRTEAGRAAAFSHTASLAGPYRLFEAAARSRGVVVADDTELSVVVADALLRWPQGLPAGKGIALVSGSGGGAGLLADRFSDAGLTLAEPSEATRATLNALSPRGDCVLPLDAGALKGAEGEASLDKALRALAADAAVGALVYLMTTQPAMAETAGLLSAIERDFRKPVILILSAGSVADGLRAKLRQERVLHCNRIDDATRIARGLVDYARSPHKSLSAKVDAASAKARPALAKGVLAPLAAFDLVRSLGIAVVETHLADGRETALAKADAVGCPVVLKAVGPGIVHKTERNGVPLDLRSAQEVSSAYHQLSRSFGGAMSGALVQRLERGVAELILGTLHDRDYGPFVVVGAGGIQAELLNDVKVAPAPIGPGDALALIQSLGLYPLLDGARGAPKADVASAAEALAAVSRLSASLGETLAEFEINPLIVKRAGEGSVAVDVRARIA